MVNSALQRSNCLVAAAVTELEGVGLSMPANRLRELTTNSPGSAVILQWQLQDKSPSGTNEGTTTSGSEMLWTPPSTEHQPTASTVQWQRVIDSSNKPSGTG